MPDAFFKAFLTVKNNVFNTIAFIMPNSSEHNRIQDYALSVNDLEQLIGCDLFTSIDDRYEEIVESDVYFRYWGKYRVQARVSYFYLQIHTAPISSKTGGLLAVARGGRILCARFMALSS